MPQSNALDPQMNLGKRLQIVTDEIKLNREQLPPEQFEGLPYDKRRGYAQKWYLDRIGDDYKHVPPRTRDQWIERAIGKPRSTEEGGFLEQVHDVAQVALPVVGEIASVATLANPSTSLLKMMLYAGLGGVTGKLVSDVAQPFMTEEEIPMGLKGMGEVGAQYGKQFAESATGELISAPIRAKNLVMGAYRSLASRLGRQGELVAPLVAGGQDLVDNTRRIINGMPRDAARQLAIQASDELEAFGRLSAEQQVVRLSNPADSIHESFIYATELSFWNPKRLELLGERMALSKKQTKIIGETKTLGGGLTEAEQRYINTLFTTKHALQETGTRFVERATPRLTDFDDSAPSLARVVAQAASQSIGGQAFTQANIAANERVLEAAFAYTARRIMNIYDKIGDPRIVVDAMRNILDSSTKAARTRAQRFYAEGDAFAQGITGNTDFVLQEIARGGAEINAAGYSDIENYVRRQLRPNISPSAEKLYEDYGIQVEAMPRTLMELLSRPANAQASFPIGQTFQIPPALTAQTPVTGGIGLVPQSFTVIGHTPQGMDVQLTSLDKLTGGTATNNASVDPVKMAEVLGIPNVTREPITSYGNMRQARTYIRGFLRELEHRSAADSSRNTAGHILRNLNALIDETGEQLPLRARRAYEMGDMLWRTQARVYRDDAISTMMDMLGEAPEPVFKQLVRPGNGTFLIKLRTALTRRPKTMRDLRKVAGRKAPLTPERTQWNETILPALQFGFFQRVVDHSGEMAQAYASRLTNIINSNVPIRKLLERGELLPISGIALARALEDFASDKRTLGVIFTKGQIHRLEILRDALIAAEAGGARTKNAGLSIFIATKQAGGVSGIGYGTFETVSATLGTRAASAGAGMTKLAAGAGLVVTPIEMGKLLSDPKRFAALYGAIRTTDPVKGDRLLKNAVRLGGQTIGQFVINQGGQQDPSRAPIPRLFP